MSISIENILPVSPEVFFSKLCGENKKYRAVGVHSSNILKAASSDNKSIFHARKEEQQGLIDLFAQRVPVGTEWVIGYEIKIAGAGAGETDYMYNSFLVNQTGLALIPIAEETKTPSSSTPQTLQ